MSYQALYRVWRPRTFADVVGQEPIIRTLKNAIMQDKFSHAYLFSGPRGTGKTSAAKIFAKTINCEHAPVEEACNECVACKGIQDGSISDVIEIDAASNNGVEQIRDIRDKVKYAPSAVKYKVYIIDEVHMLSIGAFNALLKTLEEPPKHVVFILATTEPHKIPLTIISRCQRFDFKRINQQAMVNRMQEILEKEQITVSDDAVESVALAAEGGMRDALSLLDQAISYSEDGVELADVLAVTGAVSQDRLTEVIRACARQDVQTALEQVDLLIQDGKDPGRFVFDLIYYLRDLLMFQSAPGMENILERVLVDDSFKQLAEEVDASWIQAAIVELNRCQQEIKWANSPKVFVEIAILHIADQSAPTASVEAEAVQQLTRKISQLEQELKQLKLQPQSAAAPAEQPKRPVRTGSKNSYRVPFERIRQVLSEATKDELKLVAEHWASFMDALKRQSAPAHATILNSKPRAASQNALIIGFKYEIHCSLALEHKDTIESLLAERIGHQVMVIPVPEANWTELREDFLKNQKQQDPSEDGKQEEDPIIAEARKLVGDDLLEIKD
ncbi:DNA polymerase III subunit gamma/tau [Terribacillus saccharophilus]|jgi:DNA polymerase III subunit gamma/tau|uniref:DNA-directed DNA polymerase n=1 Tax=Terribacillus saccharophilus TaxID=361277 RepID=A0ABX4GTR5_9BACI|nr:DNA polymerase III subunit gamma/tau [Terribacillus saccharophilus]PAD33716.1 DNA polymerase III subunit gamma/tau [Terribacillus saccharophilus]PAD94527.1 DNA polymerase III subunit gamma/tau [Terribacillus saccharophilus]PAD98257.1 DNA polymerase III subunit gamma/tau [Terribacillus saccharophilus]